MSKDIFQNTLDKMESKQYPIVIVPFHGEPVAVMLRKLTQAQTLSCGEISLIETFHDKIRKQSMIDRIKMSDICAYSERNVNLLKKAIVKPTYEEIINRIDNGKTIEIRNQIELLKEKITVMKPGPKKSALKTEIDSLRVWCDFILPEDFTSSIISYTLGIDESDIKELSEKMLIEAAILAERGHDNPADHIKGAFTDFMIDDINKRAWLLLEEERKAAKNGR